MDWFTVIQFKEKQLAEIDQTTLFAQVSGWQTPQWVTTFLPSWVVLSLNTLRALNYYELGELCWYESQCADLFYQILSTMMCASTAGPSHVFPLILIQILIAGVNGVKASHGKTDQARHGEAKVRYQVCKVQLLVELVVEVEKVVNSWQFVHQDLQQCQRGSRKNALANVIHSVYNPLSPLYNNVLVTKHWRQVFNGFFCPYCHRSLNLASSWPPSITRARCLWNCCKLPCGPTKRETHTSWETAICFSL